MINSSRPIGILSVRGLNYIFHFGVFDIQGEFSYPFLTLTLASESDPHNQSTFVFSSNIS